MSALTEATDRAGALLSAHIGLRLEPWMRGRLARAIREASSAAGVPPEKFVTSLGDDREALQRLCDRVTVQESGFFRHPEQFEVLAEHILPTLQPPVRIWSAACGNGQEAYSLAMTLAEAGVEGRVTATDVSTAAVERVIAARYAEREMAGLSAARRAAFCHAEGDSWTMNRGIRDAVDVSVWNLIGSLPPAVAGCQVVFCRNVLIYFTPAHATAFLDRLADQLRPGARVFLGGAESIWHVSDRFEAQRFGEAYVYRLGERARNAAAAASVLTAAPAPRRRSRASTKPPSRRSARQQRPASADAAPKPSTAAELAGIGRDAQLAGDHAAAVRAFRQWAYVNPDDPLAHFHLGLALEASDDPAAASRAFSVTRLLLQRDSTPDSLEAFGGYTLDDVLRLLDAKQDGLR